jgi:hypothetical protein
MNEIKKARIMKKSYLIIVAVAIAFNFSSCSKSDIDGDNSTPSSKQTLTFISGDETINQAKTRTSMGGAYTDSQFPFYWESGDNIYSSSDNWTTPISSTTPVTSHASKWLFTMGLDGTASTYPVRYTGTGSYTSVNQRDATYSFTTTSGAKTLVIKPVQTISTWNVSSDGTYNSKLSDMGDCGTATASKDATTGQYKFKLAHKAAYLILMPRWGSANSGNSSYKLKSVTVTTNDISYLISGRFSFDDSGIGSHVANTNGCCAIKVNVGGSTGVALPTAKDQTKSINIAIHPIGSTDLYCVYDVTDGTHDYYICKIINASAIPNGCAAGTVTPITADIQAGYNLANTNGYLDLITDKNPYTFYDWDVPNDEECYVSYEMKYDYNPEVGITTASNPTAPEGARTDWCIHTKFQVMPTFNQLTWYIQAGCYWDANKVWGPGTNQKGGMWLKKKQYIIGVVKGTNNQKVTSETFNSQQSGVTTKNVNSGTFLTLSATEKAKYFFIPAAGFYDDTDGKLKNVGTNGYTWSNTPNKTIGSAFALYISSTRAYISTSSRSSAKSMRIFE